MMKALVALAFLGGTPPTEPAKPTAPPAHLQAADPELREAWRAYIDFRFSDHPLARKPWSPDVLEEAGLDWEKLYGGGAANVLASLTIPRDLYFKELVERGSERSVRYLGQMYQLRVARDAHRHLQHLLMMVPFIEEGASLRCEDGCLVSGDGYWRSPEATVVFLPPELQQQVLEELGAYVHADAHAYTLRSVLNALYTRRRQESRDVFIRALAIPDEQLRQIATDALQELGDKPATLPKEGLKQP
jgi:hypothetical protein